MSFPRYPAYKDSGVEWLGEIPGHWEVTRLKNMAAINMGQSPSSDNCTQEEIGLPFLQGNADFGERCPLPRSYCSVANKLANTNDILFSVRAPVGAINVADQSYGIGRGLCAITAKSEHSMRFVFHALQVMKSELFAVATGSTYEAVSTDQVGNATCLAPPLPEQTQIATFLERETAKIDALVAEQRRLMALLKEKRQAVISHAVTRGLNPDAPMKSSGIEWLGDVPDHWETRTIAKASTKITNGFVGPTRDILVEAGTPYIQATHIKNGCVNFDDGYFVRPEWSVMHSKSILCEGDVLIVQTGAGTGDVGLVSENEVGYNCHALIIVAPDRTLLHGTYLSAVLQSTYGQEKLTSIETGAMHPHLNCGEVKFVEIPLPPLDEQSGIVSYINRSAYQFDTLTTEAQRAIDLLQERRTALISAAVTGQIDVRGAVQ